MKNYDSIENQEIKGRFVAREVMTCFSYEMDAILKASSEHSLKELPSYDDIENPYYFDDEEVRYSIIKEYANNPDTFNRRVKTKGDFEVFINSLNEEELRQLCLEFGIDISDMESKPHEIYEWWIVSDYLFRKLKKYGEPVLEWGNNYYWGRTTTGQAISLDYVISQICEDMEILAGQKYSWERKEAVKT